MRSRLLVITADAALSEQIISELGDALEIHCAHDLHAALTAPNIASTNAILIDLREANTAAASTLESLGAVASHAAVVAFAAASQVTELRTHTDDVLAPAELSCGIVPRAVHYALEKARARRQIASLTAKVEAAHKESARHLAVILEDLPVALWTADSSLRVELSAGSLFEDGLPTNAHVGDLFRGDDGAEETMVTAHISALTGGEARLEQKHGDRIYEVLIRRDDHAPGRGLIGVALDVTEQRKLQREFRQAQKMEAIGRLAGGIAHDFNNLLTAMFIFGEFVKGALDPDQPAYEDMIGVLEAAQKARALTMQLLAFSRRQNIEPKVLLLNEVIEATDRMLRRILGEDIELVLALDDELWKVEVDATAFEQVLMNLCVNARDAMPEGGELTITTSNVAVTPQYGHFHGVEMEPGDYALIEVADTGCGMSEAVSQHIFEPFFTTKGQHEGTGLGLSTCYGIVKQARGFIFAYSQVDAGTTIKIFLPRSVAAPLSQTSSRPIGLLNGNESILVVEDSPAIRQVVARVLASRGYTVHCADSGEAAIEMVGAGAPHIDLLLTDVVMPRMTGRELADSMGKQFPNLKVLYMSGYSPSAIARHGVEASQSSCLAKPFTPDALLTKVRHVLDSDGYTLAATRPKILIVDDDLRLLQAMATLLRTAYDVATAPSGPAALEELGRRSFDLILCDVIMPGMSGVDLAQIIVRKNPRTAERVVLCTAGDTTDLRRMPDGRSMRVLAKPFRMEDVRALLEPNERALV